MLSATVESKGLYEGYTDIGFCQGMAGHLANHGVGSCGLGTLNATKQRVEQGSGVTGRWQSGGRIE